MVKKRVFVTRKSLGAGQLYAIKKDSPYISVDSENYDCFFDNKAIPSREYNRGNSLEARYDCPKTNLVNKRN